MERITRVIRVGAAVVFVLALAVGYSTVSAGPISPSAPSNCDDDPYCHWIPRFTMGCYYGPCHSVIHLCCLP